MRGETRKMFWHHYLIVNKKMCHPEPVVVECLGAASHQFPLIHWALAQEHAKEEVY